VTEPETSLRNSELIIRSTVMFRNMFLLLSRTNRDGPDTASFEALLRRAFHPQLIMFLHKDKVIILLQVILSVAIVRQIDQF